MIARDSTGESVAVAGGTIVVGAVTVVGASATDKTAPILAFVGAILVALVTAYTANRRQLHALDEESKRQGLALAARVNDTARRSRLKANGWRNN